MTRVEGTIERGPETAEGSGGGQKLERVDQEMGVGWQEDEKWDVC